MDIKLNFTKLNALFPILSNYFDQGFTVEKGEYTLTIPPEFGNGTITGINYPNGVGLLQFDVTFKENINLIYGQYQIQPLRFVYCLKNNIVHKFNNEDLEHTIDKHTSAIIANRYPYGDTYTIFKDQDTSIAFLEIDRKVFTSQLSEETYDMKSIFYEMFFDVFATRTIFHSSLFSLQLADLLKQIKDFGQDGYIRTNFIGAKALEMLSFMLMQYEDDLRDEGTGRVLRKSEISAVHQVAGIINANLADLEGVDALAREVGLTPAKLQEVFKLLYNYTVNQYIVDRRLERGYWLLNETDSHISEVVLQIGLSSRSHFSKIFKEKYDISPNEIKMQRRHK